MHLSLIVLSIIIYTVPYNIAAAQAQQPTQPQGLPQPQPWKITETIITTDISADFPWGFDLINRDTGESILEANADYLVVIISSSGVPRSYNDEYWGCGLDLRRTDDGIIYGIHYSDSDYFYYLVVFDYNDKRWYDVKELGNFINPYYEIDATTSYVVVARHNKIIVFYRSDYSTRWSKTFDLPVEDFAMVVYDNEILMALKLKYGDNYTISVLHIDVDSGVIEYNYTISFPVGTIPGVFRIRDLNGDKSTVGYVVFGDTKVYIYDPVLRVFNEYRVNKPIRLILSGTRYNDYYALLYGTQDDGDPELEGYITDLCGYEKYVFDTYTYDWTLPNDLRIFGAALTPNYVLATMSTSDGVTTVTTFKWEPRTGEEYNASISIYSSVYAAIYVNGSYIDSIEPDTWSNFTLNTGYYNITIISYETYTSILAYLSPSEHMIIVEPLKPSIIQPPPENGTITIIASHLGFHVYINGSYIGYLNPGENITLELHPGVYNLTFVAEGRKPATYILTLSSGENITLIDPLKNVETPTTPQSPTPTSTLTNATTTTIAPSQPSVFNTTITVAIVAVLAVILTYMYIRKRKR